MLMKKKEDKRKCRKKEMQKKGNVEKRKKLF